MAVPAAQQVPLQSLRPAGAPHVRAGARRLASSLERVERRPRKRATGAALAVCHYRAGSWRAQRILHRAVERWKLLVSGRGVGKTHACAYELLQLVLDAPPGSEGAVLAPTLTHAEAAVAKLRELAAGLPGVTDESWVTSRRRLMLPGGRSIKVFSADRKEVVRGPSIVALWIDEAALVSAKAIEASLPALRRPGVRVTLLISTTPAGKNWVFEWWEQAKKKPELGLLRLRFKGTESPYNDQAVIALYRETASPEKFAQEYLAEFVDNILLAFPDRDFWVDSHPPRKDVACWLGVDVGQSDFYSCTLANEFGDVSMVGRWNEDTPGFRPATYFQQSQERVLELARLYGATVVVDTGGRAGAPGAVLAEQLRTAHLKDGKAPVRVLEVKTSSQGTKAEIVEQARLDVQAGLLRVLRDGEGWHKVLDYEMSRFCGTKNVVHGREIMSYEGPQIRGEHDDTVISFCLANWGRSRGEKVQDPLKGDFSGFAEGLALGGQAPAAGGGELGDWALLKTVGPVRYVEAAQVEVEHGLVEPVLWRVLRGGRDRRGGSRPGIRAVA